jgi:hypothetical protein
MLVLKSRIRQQDVIGSTIWRFASTTEVDLRFVFDGLRRREAVSPRPIFTKFQTLIPCANWRAAATIRGPRHAHDGRLSKSTFHAARIVG